MRLWSTRKMWRVQLVLALLWTVCVPSVRCLDLSEEFKRHSSMVAAARYPCDRAQPRVFYLEELVEEARQADETATALLKDHIKALLGDHVRPKWSVLHRCDSTGCCVDPEKKCLPTIVEEVKLTFMKTDGTVQYFQIPFGNHTGCRCQYKNKSGKSNIK